MRGSAPNYISAKDRLHNVATDLFYRRGVRAVSVDDITLATGVTKPTLYRNFGSKEELVEGCVAADARRMLDGVDAAIFKEANGIERVRAIARFFADETTSGRQRGLLLFNASVEYPDPAHPVREIAARTAAAIRARIVDALALAAGPEAQTTADHILLLIQGASAGCHSIGCQPSADALVAAVNMVLSRCDPLSFAERARLVSD